MPPTLGGRSRTCHLISLSATHVHVRHADIPGIRIIPYATIHPPRLSPLFPRCTRPFGHVLRKYIFQNPAARHLTLPNPRLSTSQGLPFSLNYRSGQRYSCTPVVNRLHRVLKHAHSHLIPSQTYTPASLPSLLLSYAQCPSSRTHVVYADENRSPHHLLNGYHTPELAHRKGSLAYTKSNTSPTH